MKNIANKKTMAAEAIARQADKGGDISKHFTNKGRVVRRVNVDFTTDMLKELDDRAEAMNVSRQAVIKFFIRQELDQHYLAAKQRV